MHKVIYGLRITEAAGRGQYLIEPLDRNGQVLPLAVMKVDREDVLQKVAYLLLAEDQRTAYYALVDAVDNIRLHGA